MRTCSGPASSSAAATDLIEDRAVAAAGAYGLNATLVAPAPWLLQVVALQAANAPPTVTTIANQASAEGETIALGVAAADPDLDALTYSATGLPVGLGIDTDDRRHCRHAVVHELGQLSGHGHGQRRHAERDYELHVDREQCRSAAGNHASCESDER